MTDLIPARPDEERAERMLLAYRDEAPRAFVVPELDRLVAAKRRRRLRGVLGGFVAVIVAAVTAGVGLAIAPAQRPLPDVPPPKVITNADWSSATITLPASGNGCPTGRQRLRPGDPATLNNQRLPAGTADVPGDARHDRLGLYLSPQQPVYGDLTGDGRPEAVLLIRCLRDHGPDMEQSGNQLLVVTLTPDRGLVGLAYVGPANVYYPSYRISNGRLVASVRYNTSDASGYGSTAWDVAFNRTYAWNGSAFVQVAGRTEPLRIAPGKTAIGTEAPVVLPAILHNDKPYCPRWTYALDGVNGFPAGPYDLGEMPLIVDLDGDGNEEMITEISCTINGHQVDSVYVLGQGDNEFITLDVPLANDGRWEVVDMAWASGKLTLTLKVLATGKQETHVFTWNGKQFTPHLGAYQR